MMVGEVTGALCHATVTHGVASLYRTPLDHTHVAGPCHHGGKVRACRLYALHDRWATAMHKHQGHNTLLQSAPWLALLAAN